MTNTAGRERLPAVELYVQDTYASSEERMELSVRTDAKVAVLVVTPHRKRHPLSTVTNASWVNLEFKYLSENSHTTQPTPVAEMALCGTYQTRRPYFKVARAFGNDQLNMSQTLS